MKKMVLLAIVLFFLPLLFTTPVSAQGATYESPWAPVIGMMGAFMAVACSASSVLQLSVYPQTFWMLNFLAGILLLISFSISNFEGPVFAMALFSTVMVVIIILATTLAKNVAKKVK